MLIFTNQETVAPRADSLKQYHLHPVRVIAEGPQSSIGAVQIISKPQNLDSISESIKHAPGLSLTYGSRDESNLKIRGFRKNENLVMVDGRPLNSGYFGNVDLSKILADDIEEIRIVKGPASALYGTSTMGGVVNIITKKQDHYLSLESRNSRNLVNSQRLSSSLGIGDFRYKLSIMRDERRPFPLAEDFEPTTFENGKLRDHYYQEAWQGDLGLDWVLGDLHELGISSGFSYIPYKKIASSIYAMDFGTYKDMFRANAGMSFDFFSSLSSNIRGQLYFDAAGDTFERFRDPDHQLLELSSRMESINIGIAPVYEWRSKGFLNTGSRIEYRRVNRKDNANYSDWTDNYALVGSVFSQYERDLSPRFKLSASLGLAFFGHSQRDGIRLHPEPSVAMSMQHFDDSSTMLSIGINSAMPTMRQLFSAENGNPELKASTAYKYELSHKQVLGKKTIADISFFYNEVKDLIDRQDNQYRNIYKVSTYGAELSVASKPISFWDTTLQYSRLEHVGDYALSDSAPHSVEFVNVFQMPMGFAVDTSFIYKSKRKSQDGIGIFRPMPSYVVLEAGIIKAFGDLELGLTIHNILDENYQSEYGYPAAGRDFCFRVKYTIR
jgi:outer membrane cobalamin receptor